MRVLILGCGYIGLALGERLVREGHEVAGLRRSASCERELQTAGIRPVYCDITQPDQLATLDRGYDWVVNCVSSSGGAVGDYRAVYLHGMQNLVSWLADAPPRRFIYTSSTSVYGQTDGSVVDETSPTEPAAETGRVLVETEKALLEAAQRRGFSSGVVRLAGIYGPGRGYWFKQFLRGEAKLEGKGERFVNMVHRDDVVGAVIAALGNGKPGEIYNVADDEPVSQLTLFQWLSKRLGRALPPFTPGTEEATRKRGVTDKRISNRKLREELGYRLQFPTFREGFEAELRRSGTTAAE